jgi:RNA polymerase sigma-32 factor
MSSAHQMANSFPMLKKGEEGELWAEYFNEGTKRSRKNIIRDKIITSHLRLALKIAKKWQRSVLPLEDLFGEAQTGLIHAFDKFSVDGGATFATYSSNWIRANVSQYVLSNTSSMKNGTTAFQKFLFFNYGKIKTQLETENPDYNQDQIDLMIAEKLINDGKSSSDNLDKTLSEIKDFQIGRSSMSSLDAPISNDGEGSSAVEMLADPNARPVDEVIEESEEKTMGLKLLLSAREEFSRIGKEREWDILKVRRLDEPKKTLEDLSDVYGVSRERVRQLEVRAIERIQVFANRDFQAKAIADDACPTIQRKLINTQTTKTRIAVPAKPSRPEPRPLKQANNEANIPDSKPVKVEKSTQRPLPVEQTEEPMTKAPVYKLKQKSVVVNRPSIQVDMVDILRSLDFSIEDYPYIPKSVDFEEMVEAVHQFALGNTDCFERSTKVIDGVEHPQTGRWVYVGATIGQPQLVSRFSTVAEWNAITQKTLGHREFIVEEEPPAVISSHPTKLKKDTPPQCQTLEVKETPSALNSGFSFIEERAAPYKPWTLNIAGEIHHLSGADKNVIEHLLNADQPQSKDELSLAQISFYGPMQSKLKEMGLIRGL